MKKLFVCTLTILLVFGIMGTGIAASINVPEPHTVLTTSIGTIGQTFSIAGSNYQLNSIGFTVANFTSFELSLYEWDATNSTVTGGELFSSGSMEISDSLTSYSVNPDVVLNGGDDYIFYMSGSGNSKEIIVAGGDNYLGGALFEYYGEPFNFWSNDPSTNIAFTMDYDQVAIPIPSALWLLFSGFACLVYHRNPCPKGKVRVQ